MRWVGLIIFTRLPVFDKSEFFTSDTDNRVGFCALSSEFGADAEFFHDIAEAIDRGVVV